MGEGIEGGNWGGSYWVQREDRILGKDCGGAGMTIRAIYEHGVFKPTDKVDLPDRTAVEFDPKILGSPDDDGASQRRLYEMLRRSFETGRTDGAERHNEH